MKKTAALVGALALALTGLLVPGGSAFAEDTGYVEGAVTYHVDGAPVVDAQVDLWTEINPGEWAFAAQDLTDAQGHYRLPAAPGSYKVCVSQNLYGSAAPACWAAGGLVSPPLDEFGNVADPSVGGDVIVGTGPTTADLSLAGATLSGTTRRATDNSLLPMSVYVWKVTTGDTWTFVNSLQDDDGQWLFHVAPGTYKYCVFGNDGELWEPRCWQNVVIPVKDPHYYGTEGPMPGSAAVTLAADQHAPAFDASLVFRGLELIVVDVPSSGHPAKKASSVTVKVTPAKRKVTLRVAVKAAKKAATGKVRILRGKKQVKLVKLSRKGTVTVKLTRQPRGQQRYTVNYLGNSTTRTSKKVVKVTIR